MNKIEGTINSNLSIPKFTFAEQNYKVKLPGLPYNDIPQFQDYIYLETLYASVVDFKRKKGSKILCNAAIVPISYKHRHSYKLSQTSTDLPR